MLLHTFIIEPGSLMGGSWGSFFYIVFAGIGLIPYTIILVLASIFDRELKTIRNTTYLMLVIMLLFFIIIEFL